MPHSLFDSLQTYHTDSGKSHRFYALSALEKAKLGAISRLPVSIRIVLESVLRNYDGKKITEAHVRQLAAWKPNAERTEEIPFVVARIVLQDFTGVPLLVDLAAMRDAARKLNRDPKRIEPTVPVDLVVDHSVQIDHYATPNALDLNMKLEFQRNRERYQFMKWGMQAFDTFKVVPPGIGIVHQVNLEHLFQGVHQREGICYPDTLVGTDSHTTMINAAGVVGWGVGGIEAEAGMLGQPLYFLTPDVIGVELTGQLRGGCTATDLVLTLTEMLRKEKVVGKFVEFFGEGAVNLTLPDRATIANMAPEYGATMGFFPVDDQTVAYMRLTGRSPQVIDNFTAYFKAQGLYGMPKGKAIQYTRTLNLDLSSVAPSLAGPRRPQDRIEISRVKQQFEKLFSAPAADGGFNRPAQELNRRHRTREGMEIGNGDVLIAAITSCTNTSNPSVLFAAGLLAKKAVEQGLKVKPYVKTSLAPGSRVVSDYLVRAGLLPYLEKLGFTIAAYGCTTCIGNAGPLADHIDETVAANELVCAAVLSGNRNFEARINPSLRANFLASPPLVVAYAIAGTMLRDFMSEPVANNDKGKPVWIGDIWPSQEEIDRVMKQALSPDDFKKRYSQLTTAGDLWSAITSIKGETYNWPVSTYIANPPFFEDFSMVPTQSWSLKDARALAIFGDSVTTDHISPAGSIKKDSPAGLWLQDHKVMPVDFNSYGSRRGNHEVMMRGTFANVRIKNLMLPSKNDGSRIEGGYTLLQPEGRQMPIYDAAMQYQSAGVPTIVFGGEEYGTGSSRDWAAKGTRLLGVAAVVARSFERIHRSNLVGMGVLPLQFTDGENADTLKLDGSESFDLEGLNGRLKPQQHLTLKIRRKNGEEHRAKLLVRIDTPIEVDYFYNGGILPYVLRDLLH